MALETLVTVCGIFRPFGIYKCLVKFLRMFLNSFCGLAACMQGCVMVPRVMCMINKTFWDVLCREGDDPGCGFHVVVDHAQT